MPLNYSFDANNLSPQSKELACIRIDPKEDRFLRKLAQYLADGMNGAFIQLCPDEIVVRDIIDYDAVNPDLSRFPLLKVYRQTDNHTAKRIREAKGVINYCIAFPEQDRLPGLLQWVSLAINILLDNYALSHEHCPSNVIKESRTAEYRVMVNEVASPVYAFLRFNFRFVEQ